MSAIMGGVVMRPRSGILVLVLVVLAACEQHDGVPARPAAAPGPDGSAWRMVDGSATTAAGAADAELATAIARARSTADDARRRWSAEPAADRAGWAVKWAAPTTEGQVEHVWIRPTAWSRHRIEGWLASPPQSPLACGRVVGELVSFPAEELSDWVQFTDGPVEGPRQGGFTIELFEQRHGSPG